MAGRQWYLAQANVETPAGTAIASPQTTTILAGDNYVQWIRWRFPPGPSGTLGISFWNGKAQIVPWTGEGSFIPGDNETETAQVGFQCFGQLNLVSYNIGQYQHEIIVSVQYQPIAVTLATVPPPAASNVVLIASDVLSQPSFVVPDEADLDEVTLPAASA
jgi:hypothetical protein